MSNQYLKLRRSNVQGKIPTTESIDFGEIALNTFDGKAYMKKSGSNGIEVVPIGSNLPDPFRIISGSIVASVNVNPNEIFLIKSGSNTFYKIENNSNTNIYSDLFIINNYLTQQPVLTVSQSIVQFTTHSIDPIDPAPNGGFYFTSTSLYIGLD
jgi:hypothetical protein